MSRDIRDERGAAALEWAISIPVLLVALALVFGAGRLWSARSALASVAREAGRAAVEASDPAQAAAVAEEVGRDHAVGYGLDSSRLMIQPQDSFDRGGRYVVVVRYELNLADLPGLGLVPGSVSMQARHSEPIDPHAAR